MNVTDLITHRDMLGYWLNQNGLLGTGVEIGSAAGQFAAHVLSTWQGKELHLVDPWENLPSNEYLEKHEGVDYEKWFQDCQALAVQDPRTKLHRMRSVEAAKEFGTSSLDWVYIDGNHSYGHVMEDLDAWHPKIRRGGLMAGHDFYTNIENGNYCQVDAAVIRWMKEHGMVFSVTPCTSWWAIMV